MTPLHQACIEGNMAVVELLVNHGADVCKADADTWTPLHAACSEGFVQVARLLCLILLPSSTQYDCVSLPPEQILHHYYC